jgi:hypothetical protein
MATPYSPISSGYTQSIRQNLIGQGVKDSDIGINKSTGYVTVGGKDAIKAPKTYNGTSYTTKQGFTDDWNNYSKSLQQPVGGQVNPGSTAVTAGQPAGNAYDPYKTNNPYDSQYNDLLKSLMDQARNPAPVDANAIYNSPQWAAYQAQAQKGAQQRVRASQESLGGAGFGRSTVLGERAQGIQNDANEYLNTQVLPQLMSQEAASRQQQFQNQFSTLDALMGQQGVYDNRFNNANQYALNKGELTGNFRDPQADQLINKILQDKQAYGAATTPEERARITQDATTNRNLLAAMGIDPASFGANRTFEQAQSGLSGAGVQTLSAKDQKFNQEVTTAQLTGKMPDGTPTTAEQQRLLQNEWAVADQTGKITPTLAEMYGIPAGTPTRAAKEFAAQLAVSQQNANTSAFSAQTSRDSLDWSRDPNNPDNIYKSAQIDALKKELSGDSSELKSELDGLYTGLSSGQIDPNAAISEIEGRQNMGFLSPDDATKMKAFVQKYLEGGSSTPKPQTVDSSVTEMTPDQLLEAWRTDPSGKAAGRAQLDWRSWMTDPRGYKSGTTYELWKSQYGPTLGG